MGVVHWFLVDETNKDYVAGKFFIVGGLVFTEQQVEEVDQLARAVRDEYGFQRGDSLKFDTNSRPAHVSIEAHRNAKQALIRGLRDIGVRMLAYVILHDLCREQPYNTRMNYALNTLVYAYHDLLNHENTTGVMLIDRDNDRYDHLESLFQNGLDFEGRKFRVDQRIRMFGMTNDNASHLSSATDVSLGAFRYCVNTAGGWGSDAVARAMFPPLAEMMWGVENDTGIKHVRGYGYQPRPIDVRVPSYLERYTALGSALEQYSDDGS